MSSLPITKPFFDEAEEKAVLETLRSGWVVQGPRVQEFEESIARFCGTKFAVATTSCTTALHLGLLSLNVGPGDEVIIPSYTFVATANAVEYCGAKPVFCDIDLKSFVIDLDHVASQWNPKTKVIVPVSLFGMPIDIERIQKLLQGRDIKILEDAACSLGASIRNQRTGFQGAIASAFSFHPRKIITTGEGGMLVTDSSEIATKIRSLRDHGSQRSDLERHKTGQSLLPSYDILGYNYRMTDLQASIGLGQMKKIDSLLAARKKGATIYSELLKDMGQIIPPMVPADYSHSYQSYVLLLSPGDRRLPTLKDLEALGTLRNNIMIGLQQSGIGVRQGTHAVHTLGYYQKKYGFSERDFPNSLLADRLSIALPLFQGMTDSDFERVVSALRGQLCAA